MSTGRARARYLPAIVALSVAITLPAASGGASRPAGDRVATSTTLVTRPATPHGTQRIDIIATVMPDPDGGDVRFLLDGEILGQTFLRKDGTADWSQTLTLGDHVIEARFLGRFDYAESTSGPITITQRPALVPGIWVVSPDPPIRAGAPVHVGGRTSARGAVVRGWIAVDDSPGVEVGVGDGTGRFGTWDDRPALGTHTVTALLGDSGGRDLRAASCTTSFEVRRRTTDPRLVLDRETIREGKAMWATLVAWPPGTQAPPPHRATVELFRADTGGHLVSGPLFDGRAHLNLTLYGTGRTRIVARLAPAEWFTDPDASAPLLIKKGLVPPMPEPKPGAARTTTTLTVEPNDASQGDPVTVTATVRPIPDGGRVDFHDGIDALREVWVGPAGRATWTARLEHGTYAIVATYLGNRSFRPSRSAPVPLVVTDRPSTTTLEVAPEHVVAGEPVILTAMVHPPPTGTSARVDFGIESAVVDPTGLAQVAVSDLPAGTHRIRARYRGSGWVSPSASGPRDVIVDRAPSDITVFGDGDTELTGDLPDGRLRIGFDVTPHDLAAHGGVVDVFVDGIRVATTGALADGGTSLRLNPGRYVVEARFRGNAYLEPSGSDPLELQVGAREGPPEALGGTARIVGDRGRVSTQIVRLDVIPDMSMGAIRAFQVSNDGTHWATWWFDDDARAPAFGVVWSLTDPTCGGRPGDGQRTIRVRFLDHVATEQARGAPVKGGGVLRSAPIPIHVTLDR